MKRTRNRLTATGWTVAGLVGLLFLAGCDNDNDDAGGDSGPPTVNVSGVWTGTSTDATGSVRWRSGIRFDLQQRADGTVRGTVKVAGTEAATGVVNGNVLTLTVPYSTSVIGSVGTYRLEVTGNSLSGRYVESQWTNGKYKTVEATRSGLRSGPSPSAGMNNTTAGG